VASHQANHIGNINNINDLLPYLPYNACVRPYVSLVHSTVAFPATSHRHLTVGCSPPMLQCNPLRRMGTSQATVRLATAMAPSPRRTILAERRALPHLGMCLPARPNLVQAHYICTISTYCNFRFMRANRGHAESLSHPEKPQYAVSVTNVK
jgi:hypothetical protein